MKKYFKLYKKFFKVNLMKSLAYRKNFLLGMFLVCVESIAVLLTVSIIFNHIGNISGWGYHDTLVLTGIFMLTHAFAWLFYKGGVNQLDMLINKGDLDWLLVKPVDTQFLVSCSRIDVEDSARSFVGIPVMIYGLSGSSMFESLLLLPVFIFTFLCGQIVLYNINLLFKTISFKSIQGWATNSIFWRFHDLARFPTDIYKGALKAIYTFVFPLIFIATVPAKALLGNITVPLILGSALAALISTLITRYVWKKALKTYSSASS
ncbi:MAG: ABC-2 family transporter protein [Candidatus Magasanikbacteria bacterium]